MYNVNRKSNKRLEWTRHALMLVRLEDLGEDQCVLAGGARQIQALAADSRVTDLRLVSQIFIARALQDHARPTEASTLNITRRSSEILLDTQIPLRSLY